MEQRGVIPRTLWCQGSRPRRYNSASLVWKIQGKGSVYIDLCWGLLLALFTLQLGDRCTVVVVVVVVVVLVVGVVVVIGPKWVRWCHMRPTNQHDAQCKTQHTHEAKNVILGPLVGSFGRPLGSFLEVFGGHWATLGAVWGQEKAIYPQALTRDFPF